MGGVFGGTPAIDTSAADAARAKAEAEAQAEIAEENRKRKEEEDAIRRGLRGRKALLSEAGGELGFPSTLGA